MPAIAFLPDNDAYSCSELVRDTYRRPDGGYLFDAAPMNFLSPDGFLPQYWEDLFARLDMPGPFIFKYSKKPLQRL